MSFDYQTVYTGSQVNSHTMLEVGTASPVNSNTVSYAYVAAIPPSNSNLLYSAVSTLSPANSNAYTMVAVVPPQVTNASYSPVGTSSPVINSNIHSIGSKSTKYKKKYTERNSSYNSDNSGLNQSNSSFLSSNGSLNNSDIDRYSIVGYNTSPATKPCGRNNKAGWYEMHEKHVTLASHLRASVVLCGDSIIAGLTRYSSVWNKYFKPLNALNCGIGGDQTQHVLWRMENIVLPYTVKYIVVHCGTNNIDKNSPQEIANGVISCGLVLQENNPLLKVVITGLLPRDLENTSRRYKIIQTNKFLKRYCRQFSNFTYMKQDDGWILHNGLLNEELYYSDHLHLIESGNHKFAKSISNILDKLSKDEEVIYSSDENENDNEDKYKFERKHGETRHDTPKRQNDVYQNPFKFVRRSNIIIPKRKRSLSPAVPTDGLSSQKRRRTESYLNSKEHIKGDSSSVPKSNTTERNWNKVVKKEYHGQFSLTKKLKHDTVNDEHLEGTVKSIDISLAGRDRLEARKAKFSDNTSSVGSSLKKISDLSKANVRSRVSSTTVPSTLLVKIKKSMEKCKEDHLKKKM